MKQNLLTNNTYLCIELNAHALLTFLMNTRDNVNKNDVVFFPWLLGSLSCEKMFRSARSMSTVFSSVLNFSILGLLCRLHNLNIQAMLQVDAEKSGIRFPCQGRRRRSGWSGLSRTNNLELNQLADQFELYYSHAIFGRSHLHVATYILQMLLKSVTRVVT